jgi:spore maturation protein CgeB
VKILVVGPQWVGRWTESTHKALVDMGHTVRSFYYTSLRVEKVTLGLKRRIDRASPWLAAQLVRYGEQWQRDMNQRLVAIARNSRPDLILMLKGETVLPETIAALRQTAGRLATWWVDDPLRHTLAREAMPSYDAAFVFDRSYLDPLSQAGAAEVYFLPCCCDAGVFKPTTLSPSVQNRYRCDIAFVAVYYPARGEMVRRFAGLKVGIWGPQWDGADAQQALTSIGKDSWRGKFVNQATSVRIYNASKICLNVHHTQTHVGGLNTRAFEVPACGAFVLTDYVPGMEELLIPGEEVACYPSPDAIRPLVDYYLAHPDERARLSQRGRARVLSEHTYHHRMQTLLRALRLSE